MKKALRADVDPEEAEETTHKETKKRGKKPKAAAAPSKAKPAAHEPKQPEAVETGTPAAGSTGATATMQVEAAQGGVQGTPPKDVRCGDGKRKAAEKKENEPSPNKNPPKRKARGPGADAATVKDAWTVQETRTGSYLDLQSGTFTGSGAGLPTPAFFRIWSGGFSKSLEMWILKALHSLWLAFL